MANDSARLPTDFHFHGVVFVCSVCFTVVVFVCFRVVVFVCFTVIYQISFDHNAEGNDQGVITVDKNAEGSDEGVLREVSRE